VGLLSLPLIFSFAPRSALGQDPPEKAIEKAIEKIAEEGQEVVINDKAYPIIDGKPIVIETPNGERMTVVVRKRDKKYWAADRIRFSYPQDFEAKSEDADGLKMVTVEGGDSTLGVVQVYPITNNLVSLQTDIIGALKKEILGKKGKLQLQKTMVTPAPTKRNKKPTPIAKMVEMMPIKRQIGSSIKIGNRLTWKYMDKTNYTDVFVFNGIQNRIAVIFQWEEEETGRSMTAFEMIAQSFGIDKIDKVEKQEETK
jgi:hypothetical protein